MTASAVQAAPRTQAASDEQERVAAIRRDFPILSRTVAGGKPLIYLDNGASSQKPEAVLQAMDDYYRQRNANVHRGVHTLSEEATAAFEKIGRASCRERV